MEAKTTKVRSLCWSLVSIDELTVKPKINLKKPDLDVVVAVVEEEEEGISVLMDITNAALAHRLFQIEMEWNTWNHTFVQIFTWWKIYSNVWPSYISCWWNLRRLEFLFTLLKCSLFGLAACFSHQTFGNHFQSQSQYFFWKLE